jgi:hypothetical protein
MLFNSVAMSKIGGFGGNGSTWAWITRPKWEQHEWW